MKKINLLCISILAIFTLIFPGCKKKGTSTPTCVISKLIHTGTSADTTYYSYNNDKKVIAAVSGPNTNVYTYYSHSIVRNSTYSGLLSRDSIILGGNGLVSERYEYDNTNTLT